ncbi:PAS domain-containing protein [Martelella mediterranea]|uniref:Putative diguanylate cyclase YegE n=1 Tax=Martelella mediterranea DSM 17316 TaxID=1122214 RepID=A0A1U9Z3T1_9HYPH|nr:PAS domain-containing protein [Martelella mediterranea]AQZ52363.1 putative diguanylate cyclase YegE [Martelella mediterranea DSM 17316]
MNSPLKPNAEEKRLAALRKLEVIDTQPEAEFDALARAAALVCGTPVSLISLIDRDRQWFKANVGLEGLVETERRLSFCTYAIEGDGLLEVGDARKDERFAANPFVTGDPGIRFYAGVPLKLSGGENVGSLCVIDMEARSLSDEQRQILSHLAEATARALEMRRAFLHENELLAAAAETQSILQNSEDAIVTMDMGGRITRWNRAAERMFGYAADEALGASAGIMAGDDTAAYDPYSRLRELGNARTIRTERRHRDGSAIPVSVSIGPVVSEDGDIVGATEIIRDISDILATQNELSQAEQRLRRLYQSTPAMLHAVDPDGRLLSVSDRWLEVMGYCREDVLGRPLADFMPGSSARRFRTELLPALASEGYYEDVEAQMTTRSGAVIEVLLSAVIERGASGEVLRSIGIVENVTYRRQIEMALRAERRRLGQIIEGTGAGTWEWNVITGENRVNDEWAAMLGYTLKELAPVTIDAFRDRIHPDDRPLLDARIDAHFNGETNDFEAELRIRHKDGQWIWIATRGRVLARRSDGRPEWMFGIHVDITVQKRREEELRLSKELLDRTGQVAGVGGWELDLVEGRLRWSKETCRIHDVEPDYEPQLDTAINFYAPDSQALIMAAVEKCIATGEGWDLELQLITARGKLLWVRAVGSAEYANGRVVRMVGTFQDISEAVAQRKALEEVNRLFSVATETGRIGIWDADLVTGKTNYSDIWCELIGYTREEVTDSGTAWQSFIHPDDMDRALAADAAHVRGEAPIFEEQFRMRHKDGRWIWILDRGLVTERDDEGRPLRMIGTHTDITRQKEREAERLLNAERMAIAADNGGIGIWEINLSTNEASWDAGMYRLYGLSPDTSPPLLEVWERNTHEEDAARVSGAVRRAIENDDLMDEEYRVVWPDGSVHHLHGSARLVRGVDGGPDRFIGVTWDVTEERQLALDLGEQHELMRVTLDSIGDAVITANADGTIRWLNPIAEHMTGWSTADAEGEPSHRVFSIIHEESREPAMDPIRTCLELRQVVGLSEDTLLISRDGRAFAIEDSCAPIRNGEGEVLGAVLVFHDVSEQRRLAREMSYRASHDQLTGLINRSEFERRMYKTLDAARAGGPDSALLFIDLDRFKIVNDSCGHAVGDELLIKISRLIQGVIRANDALARLGGDEFAAIIENCPIDIAQNIAQKICDAVADFVLVHEGKHYRIGASIGLARINDAAASVATILQEADAACYAAKEEGRNRVHVWRDYDEAVRSLVGQTSWVTRIEEALEEDGFVLYAQKIVPFSGTGGKTHVELLLRMIDENGGVIPPSAFLPASERFNLATRIDRWVLAHALEWMQSAGAGPQSVVSVNVSGQSVGDRGFHRFALELLDGASEAVRRSLCLEITETSVISNMAEAMEFIRALRDRGVMIALDDFGAGSSSFSYLKRFSIDFLKIDGQFAQGLLTHPVDEATIRCFVEMARVLNIQTVAEYVSDDKIAARLRDMGVDLAQGYAYHLPEPAAGLKL